MQSLFDEKVKGLVEELLHVDESARFVVSLLGLRTSSSPHYTNISFVKAIYMYVNDPIGYCNSHDFMVID